MQALQSPASFLGLILRSEVCILSVCGILRIGIWYVPTFYPRGWSISSSAPMVLLVFDSFDLLSDSVEQSKLVHQSSIASIDLLRVLDN